jgi:hypothetical protein
VKTIGTVSGFTRVEDRVRLSSSALYGLQRRFYEREGMRAWASGTVPSYITCNPLIADSYAEVVLGFMRDARAAGQLARGARVPVVEVGSGSGRFGYLFLRRLQDALATSELADVAVTLVLTDFHRAKLEDWRSHPSLAPYLDDGSVDLAVLEVGAAPEAHLMLDGRNLSEVAGDGPRVLLANYVLDSVPQDAFAVRRGDLHELLVSVEAPGEPSSEATGRGASEAPALDPDVLPDLRITWSAAHVAGSCYDDPDLDAVLDHYTATLDDTTVLMPVAAVDLVRSFAQLAPGPALVIAADKGHLHHADLYGQPEPGVAVHGGCFSLMVNFDAIRRVVERRGGVALYPRERPSSLAVVAYAFGLEQPSATTGAFRRHVAERGPDDVFALRSSLSAALDHLELDQVMAYVRAYLADSTVLLECFPRLLDLATDAPEAARLDLHRLVNQVWEEYFPIGEPADLALCLGLLLAAIDRQREALDFFAESRRALGPTPTAVYAEALARLALRELDVASKLADEALALEPGFSAARRLKATLAAQQEAATA